MAKRRIASALGMAALLTACGVWAAGTTDGRLPAGWQGSPAGDPATAESWSLQQVWPDKIETWANYRPLVGKGDHWSAPSEGHGDAPSAGVSTGALWIVAEGAWGGNPGQKLAALVFTAPSAGVYSVAGRLALKRLSGAGPNHVALLRFAVDGRGQVVQNYRFRRPDPEPTVFDESVFLATGERLAWVPRLCDNTKGRITLSGLALSFTAAAHPPPDFRDGIRPAAPRPSARDEQTPKIVIEGEQIRFPADANVINVKDPPWSAKGDGVTDDTAALQHAIDEGGVIWLPNGVYLVSDQLRYTRGAKVPSRTTLHGESVKGTIIKLRDRTPDFGDAQTPLAVLWTSHSPPQAFHIHVRNLTMHTGRGNSGAIGIQFYANNQGSIEDVRVQSGDGSGAIGLDLGFSDDQGPMLARGIRVEGFDVGIRCARQTTVTTLEDIAVEGQRHIGFLNDMHAVAMRHFTSRNRCPAFEALDPAAYTALIDSHIDGLDGAGPWAILNEGGMYLRGVAVTGYPLALTNAVSGGCLTPAALPAEWVSHPVLMLRSNAVPRGLGLPVEETPRAPWGPLGSWVSVKAFAPETVDTGKTYRGKKVTYENWAPAVQRALDAGQPTVYFPRGNYIVDGVLNVPPHVRRIIGIESSFDRDRGQAEFRIAGAGEPVTFERWDWTYSHVTLRHAGPRTVVVRNTVGSHYQAEPGAGDAFFEDACQSGVRFLKGQHIWMRQFNPEYGDVPKIINDGADLWILGIKTEGYSTMIVTRNGGRTEVIGGSAYANQGRPHDPLFINLMPSSFSCSIAEWILRSQHFDEVVVEQTAGAPRVLCASQVPKRGLNPDAKPLGGYGTSSMIPLFSGWEASK